MEEVEYIKNFVDDPSRVFDTLFEEIPFEKLEQSPRLEYYMNDHDVPYAYGVSKHARVFHPGTWHPLVLDIRKKLEDHYGCVFEVCFINCYMHHRHHLGWHADDSPEMDDDRPIVTVSLGAEREIWFREKGTKDPVKKVLLENGSSCAMPAGFQENHEHRIPKHDRECGARMSLTFRGLTPSFIPRK